MKNIKCPWRVNFNYTVNGKYIKVGYKNITIGHMDNSKENIDSNGDNYIDCMLSLFKYGKFPLNDTTKIYLTCVNLINSEYVLDSQDRLYCFLNVGMCIRQPNAFKEQLLTDSYWKEKWEQAINLIQEYENYKDYKNRDIPLF